MDIRCILLVLSLHVLFFNAAAQRSCSVEVSAGLAYAYSAVDVSPQSFYIRQVNKLNATGSAKFNYSPKPPGSVSFFTQIGISPRILGLKLQDIPYGQGIISKYVKYATINSPYVTMGATISSKQKKLSFFIAPSIGVLYNPDRLSWANLSINPGASPSALYYQHLRT